VTSWPPLPYRAWEQTKETIHRYVQIVGKVRMTLVPFRNHWWHVTLYVSARGLTTGAMPYGDLTVEIEFDFIDHHLNIRTSDGRIAGFPLRDRTPCARFYTELFNSLEHVGVHVEVNAKPFDLGDSTPFPDDTLHDSYDAAAVERWWRILQLTHHTLAGFASGFTGKVSPIHLFWHSLDLAHTRFSGRRAPAIEGADPVTAEAYSHELISFGWWPGDNRRTPYPAFYSYTAPEPAGLSTTPLSPAAAEWQDTGNGSLAVLPYEAVQTASDGAAMLLSFYESAYQAGAALASWDTGLLRTS
jgi:hypothetical protein